VQGHFFDRFFGAANLGGARLLDFGCGNGFYSNRFAKLGVDVVGVDTSPELIEIARGNYPGIDFRLAAEGDADGGLAAIPSGSFDLIYMSDVLLFFFYDPKTHQRNDAALKGLLSTFRRILKPTGTLYFMEPNATFWLAPWYGAPPIPYTVVTEYRNHLYSVAPTPDEVISALGQSGFAVTTFKHPDVQDHEPSIDAMAHAFARGFPLWDFYGCRPFLP
jgi:SAM-dependent methyltransferase